MENDLRVGGAEVDITPPVGTLLAGALKPRTSACVQDPLTIKAVVIESCGRKLCYVILDLIWLPREYGDAAVELAFRKSGVPAQNIVWSASHTHTGPYVNSYLVDDEKRKRVDTEWMRALPFRFAEAVEKAASSLVPAMMSRSRGYCYGVSCNRRLKFKDGREINKWLLDSGEDEVQSLGTAAPVDPEVGILCFDDEKNVPIAVLWNFALHANGNFGPSFSADFPGVVASRLMERFGRNTVTLFMPGACGDINPMRSSYRDVGDMLADEIIARLDKRVPCVGAVALGALKENIVAPWRDPGKQADERIAMSQWDADSQLMFRKEAEYLKSQSVKEDNTLIQVWRIGDIGFASLPGEAFVELGLEIKRRSPFPWTYPVELGGDYVGYLVTEQAWQAGGYESLVARLARVSVEGVRAMVEKTVEMLGQLYKERV